MNAPDTPDAAPAPAGATTFARLPVLDGKRGIVGYELVAAGGTGPGPQRDAELLLQAIALGDESALGGRRDLFVRCGLETLDGDHLALADPAHLVIEVALPTAATTEEIEAGAAILFEARRRGFRLALRHEALASAWAPWLALAGFLKIDAARLPPAALPAVVKAARRHGDLKLIACGVETAQQQADATALGLAWFQGPWFTQPVWVRSQVVRPSQAIILELVGLVRRGAELSDIETLLKRDPALSFNLLRFINSSGFGLSCEITSFSHAAMILGMDKLLRWACLLIATARDGASPAVGHTAVVRGRLMELLAGFLLTPEECDHAFVAGVFSLLDAMTGVPMAKALEGLPLPAAILDALLARSGPLAPFLELTEACEQVDDAAFARAIEHLQLSGHQVNMAHLQALAWAETLMAG